MPDSISRSAADLSLLPESLTMKDKWATQEVLGADARMLPRRTSLPCKDLHRKGTRASLKSPHEGRLSVRLAEVTLYTEGTKTQLIPLAPASTGKLPS
jgi:hypothetical protein